MSSPVAWGDVPTWLQAVGGLAQVGHVVWSIQTHRAANFAEKLRETLGLSDADMAERITSRPELASLVLNGIEHAMRCHADEKRWLLARVVATAFEGDDARIDDIALFLRTAAALEPPDVRVLVEISRPRPDNFPDVEIVGAIRDDELAAVLAEDQRHLLLPIIATLVREGLIVDEAVGTLDYRASWLLSPYGFAFLRFLPAAELPDLRSAILVAVHGGPRLLVKNLGPAAAVLTAVSVTTDGRDLLGPVSLPIEIAAGQRVELPADNTVDPGGGARISLAWQTPNGELFTAERVHWRR